MNIRKKLSIPLKYSMLVMFLTFAIFLWGPIQWGNEFTFGYLGYIFLILLYFLAFLAGFRTKLGSENLNGLRIESDLRKGSDVSPALLKMLKVTILLNIFFTIFAALIYSDVTGIADLWAKALIGLRNPGAAYFSKNAGSRAGNIGVQLMILYSPIQCLTKVYGLYSFKKLNLFYKIVYVLSIVLEILRWLSIGTNKGLMDIILLGVTYFLFLLIRREKSKVERKNVKKRIRRMILLLLVAVIAFLSYFSFAVYDRGRADYTVSFFEHFPYYLVPESLRPFLQTFTSYVSQGYNNYYHALQNCEWHFTYGVGNSRFLMSAIKTVFGVDLTPLTYPYQLGQFGVDPLASWHTAYAWFACDLSAFGVIILMFLAGYFLCSVTVDVVVRNDAVSMALFYLMILMITNASCVNYVFAYSDGFVSFWALFVVWFLNKKIALTE